MASIDDVLYAIRNVERKVEGVESTLRNIESKVEHIESTTSRTGSFDSVSGMLRDIQSRVANL
jgi:uncharacterized protein YoxC